MIMNLGMMLSCRTILARLDSLSSIHVFVIVRKLICYCHYNQRYFVHETVIKTILSSIVFEPAGLALELTNTVLEGTGVSA